MNQKILFVKGSYESLERLKGKTGEGPFFKVRSDRITVCHCTQIRLISQNHVI